MVLRSILTLVAPSTWIASKSAFQLPVDPSVRSQVGETITRRDNFQIAHNDIDVLLMMIEPFTMPASAPIPIREVVFLPSVTMPRTFWSALSANATPSVMSMVPTTLMIFAGSRH